MDEKRKKESPAVAALDVADVPALVFEKFAVALKGKEGVSAELVDRLQKVLLEDRDINEKALRSALFPD